MDTMTGLSLVGGGALLWLGGEGLVVGSVSIARRLGVAPVLIGVVLMGFGTSVPELVTSVDAALEGAPAIAIGNVVGSNTANILLILGLAALLSPMRLDRDALRRDTWLMALAAVCMALATIWGPVESMDGALFLLMLLVYLLLAFLVVTEPVPAFQTTGAVGVGFGEDRAALPPSRAPMPVWQSLPLGLAGIVGVVLGANIFVDGAVELATGLGVSQAVIGATVVAIGTSLPELSASVVAARRGQAELSVGNVLGSNIFNVFGVLGASAVAAPLSAEPEMLTRDLPVMLAATALLTVMVLTRQRIGRAAGAAMLAGYAGYLLLM